jgi:hypothetical protein
MLASELRLISEEAINSKLNDHLIEDALNFFTREALLNAQLGKFEVSFKRKEMPCSLSMVIYNGRNAEEVYFMNW